MIYIVHAVKRRNTKTNVKRNQFNKLLSTENLINMVG